LADRPFAQPPDPRVLAVGCGHQGRLPSLAGDGRTGLRRPDRTRQGGDVPGTERHRAVENEGVAGRRGGGLGHCPAGRVGEPPDLPGRTGPRRLHRWRGPSGRPWGAGAWPEAGGSSGERAGRGRRGAGRGRRPSGGRGPCGRGEQIRRARGPAGRSDGRDSSDDGAAASGRPGGQRPAGRSGTGRVDPEARRRGHGHGLSSPSHAAAGRGEGPRPDDRRRPGHADRAGETVLRGDLRRSAAGRRRARPRALGVAT
jgi:hypothetical protein